MTESGNIGIWFRHLCLILFLSIPTPAYAKNSPTDTSFPYREKVEFSRMPNGQYLIEVLLNDQGPFKFMIDSAATRSCLFESTTRKLGIVDYGDEEKYVNGMTASEMRPITRLESFHFAKQKFEDHDFIVLDDWPNPEHKIDGILGMDVMHDLVLHFRPKKGTVRISRKLRGSLLAKEQWSKIKLVSNPYPGKDYNLLFLGADLGERSLPALLDTGSGFTAMSWNSLQGTNMDEYRERLHEAWLVEGAVGSFAPKMNVQLKDVKFGGRRYKKHNFILMDFDELPFTNDGSLPLIIAGIDLFDQDDFVFDFARKWVYFPLEHKPPLSFVRGLPRILPASNY